MLRIFCRTKISKAVITGTELYYEGSIGIDKAILKKADLIPGEQVHVFDVNNGERLVTYVIEEPEGSGKIVLYGPAARKGTVGDELVILSYCMLENKECKRFKKKVTVLSKDNKCKKKK